MENNDWDEIKKYSEKYEKENIDKYGINLNEQLDKIIQKKYDCLTSIVFCLEDSIKDEALPMAEIELCNNASCASGTKFKSLILLAIVDCFFPILAANSS